MRKRKPTIVEDVIFTEYDENISFVDNLEHLIDAAEDSGFNAEFIEEHKSVFDKICSRLGLSERELLLLCPFLKETNCDLDFKDIADFFDCSTLKTIQLTDELKDLKEKGYLTPKKKTSFGNKPTEYRISYDALDAISQGKKLEKEGNEIKNAFEFMRVVRDAYKRRYNEEISNHTLIKEVINMIEQYKQFNIAQQFMKMQLSDWNKIVLMFFCFQAVWNDNMEITNKDLKDMFDEKGLFAFRAMIAGKHPLIEQGYVDAKKDKDSDNYLTLTPRATNELLNSDFQISIEEDITEYQNVTNHTEIKSKVLFFNKENKDSLDALNEMLQEEKFTEIKSRLGENGWNTGFACLFYGAPGTGKTESAMQLARQTKRNIMQVDISSSRTKWYGETEKLIKKIFTDYKDFASKCECMPILLFNEADAILSIRTELNAGSTSTTKSENTIQNVLLQELETFDGILIATTNLTNNLDPAFERRFLYKIKFESPSVETKSAIWRSLIKSLSKEEAMQLAMEFNFSGGEISNIARKCLINDILFGTQSNIEKIRTICQQEKLTNRAKVGF